MLPATWFSASSLSLYSEDKHATSTLVTAIGSFRLPVQLFRKTLGLGWAFFCRFSCPFRCSGKRKRGKGNSSLVPFLGRARRRYFVIYFPRDVHSIYLPIQSCIIYYLCFVFTFRLPHAPFFSHTHFPSSTVPGREVIIFHSIFFLYFGFFD